MLFSYYQSFFIVVVITGPIIGHAANRKTSDLFPIGTVGNKVQRNSLIADMESPSARVGHKRHEVEDETNELAMKILSSAQPLHIYNSQNKNNNSTSSSYHRHSQSYNQDDDTALADGFDISLYSLKYAGCSAISTFSDSLAQDASAKTVFKTIENVVFRLCPRDTCYDWTVYGCLYNYGQYIIRLDTWMQLISTYREEKIYKHCQFCNQCAAAASAASGEGDANGNNNNNRDLFQIHKTSENYKAQAFNYSRHTAGGENENNKKENEGEINCDNYSSACTDYMDTCEYVVRDPNEYSKYLTCTAVSVDNGSATVYLGPHCSSDKATIVIGVFADNQCSEYIGGSYDVYSLTGINFDLYEYYSTSCYSCDKKVGR